VPSERRHDLAQVLGSMARNTCPALVVSSRTSLRMCDRTCLCCIPRRDFAVAELKAKSDQAPQGRWLTPSNGAAVSVPTPPGGRRQWRSSGHLGALLDALEALHHLPLVIGLVHVPESLFQLQLLGLDLPGEILMAIGIGQRSRGENRAINSAFASMETVLAEIFIENF